MRTMLGRIARDWIGRMSGRHRRLEWVAIGIAALALAVGPAAVLGYARWADRDVITIRVVQWAYEPKTIYLTAGTPTHLRLISEDVVHGIAIAGLDVTVGDLVPGHAIDITVTPRQAGTYEFGCTRYCGARHGRMFGKIIVNPAQPSRR